MPAARSGTAKRYAEAVFEIAKTYNSFDRWSEELRAIVRVQADPDVTTLLSAPSVSFETKELFIFQALPDLSVEAKNLVKILLRRGRFSLAPQIADHFDRLLNDYRGIAVAEVTSAIPLTPEELSAVERRLSALTGRQVLVETNVDQSIIGGIVARIGDQLIDASVRGRLMSLKKRLASA